MFLSLSKESGLSKKSTAPSLTARMTSSVSLPSDMRTTGVSSKASTNALPVTSSEATSFACFYGEMRDIW